MRAPVSNDVSPAYNHTAPTEIVQPAISEGGMNEKLLFLRSRVIARDDVYAVQGKDGRYRKVEKELTDAALIRHLQHKITIGCYNSSTDGLTKFALVDIDNHEGKEIISASVVNEKVAKVRTTLREFEIPHILAESSPGSFHIYIFFEPHATTEEAYNFIRWVTSCAGCKDEETFPKQTHVPPGEYGNLIRLPFSKHQKKDTLYRLVECYNPADGIHQTKRETYHYIDDNDDEAETIEVGTIDITDFTTTDTRPRPADTTEDRSVQGTSTPSYNGGIPPCLQSLLSDKEPLTGGGGHYLRICIVCAYRDAGISTPAIEKLFVAQDDYDPIETKKQVSSVLKKAGGYSYSCKTLRAKCGKFVLPLCESCPRGKGLYSKTS